MASPTGTCSLQEYSTNFCTFDRFGRFGWKKVPKAKGPEVPSMCDSKEHSGELLGTQGASYQTSSGGIYGYLLAFNSLN